MSRSLLRYVRPVTLQWYVTWEFIKSFALALLVCSLFVLLLTLIHRTHELENYGVTLGQIATLAPFFMPLALTYALPLAAVIAAAMTFGRLSAENEILAAQSGGASLGVLSVWIHFVAFVISIFSLWCNGALIEWGYACIRDRIVNYENRDFVESLEKEGNTLSLGLEGGRKVAINMLPRTNDPASGAELRPIHVTYFKNHRIEQSFYARHHTYAPPQPNAQGGATVMITLQQGQSLNDDRIYKVFDELALPMDLPPLDAQIKTTSGTDGFITNWIEARQLRSEIDRYERAVLDRAAELAAQVVAGSLADPIAPLSASVEWVEARMSSETVRWLRERSHRKEVECHRKIALSFIPLSMVVLGIGLGLLSRKSQRLVGFLLGLIAAAVLYYPLMVTFKELATAELLPIWSLWVPNVFVLLAGFGLWWVHERGYMSTGLPLLRAWRTDSKGIVEIFLSVSRWFDHFNLPGLLFIRRKTSRHVVQSFLGPLLTVMLAIGVSIITLDLVERGNEVLNSVLQAPRDEPARSIPVALRDVAAYYAIRVLALMFEVMPLIILIAGALAVTVMVRNNEHLIYKASGRDLRKVFMPMLGVAACISVSITVLREVAMPALLMEVDRLKPLVYHRSAKVRSMAGQTRDADNRNMVYEIGSYNRNEHLCEQLRIYRIDDADKVDGRIVRLTADRGVWDEEGDRWLLRSTADTTVREHKKSADTVSEKPHELKWKEHGLLLAPVEVPDGPDMHRYQLAVSAVSDWRGAMSPSFLDSQELGPGVVRWADLVAMRNDRPEFRSELWRRGFEFLTGVLLLFVSIPMLVRGEVKSPLVGVAKCVGFGALYLVLGIAFAELARQGLAPSWAPVVPHLLFLGMATWLYGLRMET